MELLAVRAVRELTGAEISAATMPKDAGRPRSADPVLLDLRRSRFGAGAPSRRWDSIAGGIAGKSEGILLRCPVLPSLQRLGPIDGLRRSNPYQVSNKSRHYPARSKRVRALARIGGTKVAGRTTRRRPQQAHAESVDCSASIRY